MENNKSNRVSHTNDHLCFPTGMSFVIYHCNVFQVVYIHVYSIDFKDFERYLMLVV